MNRVFTLYYIWICERRLISRNTFSIAYTLFCSVTLRDRAINTAAHRGVNRIFFSAWKKTTEESSLLEMNAWQSMGRQSEKNDLIKTHANSYILGTFSVDINYSVINSQINKPVVVQ